MVKTWYEIAEEVLALILQFLQWMYPTILVTGSYFYFTRMDNLFKKPINTSQTESKNEFRDQSVEPGNRIPSQGENTSPPTYSEKNENVPSRLFHAQDNTNRTSGWCHGLVIATWTLLAGAAVVGTWFSAMRQKGCQVNYLG